MNKLIKRLLTAVLSVAVVLSMVIVPITGKVYADGSPNYVKYSDDVTVYKYSGEFPNNFYCMDRGKKFSKVKKITLSVSKKGVITDLECEDNGKYIYFEAKKVGKTVLTIKVKKKDGTTKKYKVNVTVKKFTSPIKKLKIGKSAYTKKLGNKQSLRFGISGKSAKVTVTPKDGWEVSGIDYVAEYCGEKDGVKDIEKTYKNGKTIKFKKNEDYIENIYFTMTEKDTGIEIEYCLQLKN